ncbi:MAG: Holliday junction branch migration protein RuvA [Candidatus Magasanikbacteria bacterium]|jgi:Holliday junction DNA helicase RuvA
MIALINGKVVINSGLEVVIMTAGGVGYRVMVSPEASKVCQVGNEVSLDTYLVVREDVLDLFGFANDLEKKLFKNFVSVSGVGPKTALHLLSLGSVEETALAIGRGDLEYLTKVSGIGKKTAERIIVELREKLAKEQKNSGKDYVESDNAIVNDVVEGLITLGYTALQAREVIKKIEVKGKKTEQLFKEALRKIK